MDKALLLVGRLQTEQGIQESYQLLINNDYITNVYDGSNERKSFYDEVSDTFVERIMEEHSPLEVGVFNGLRINPETGRHERLPKLEEALVSPFSRMVCDKLRSRPIVTVPVTPVSLRN